MAPVMGDRSPQWRVEEFVLIKPGLREFGEMVGPAFAAVLRTVYRRLRTDPEVFGEPLYHLHYVPGEVRHGAQAPLVVPFMVYPEERSVWLLNVWLLTLPDSSS